LRDIFVTGHSPREPSVEPDCVPFADFPDPDF
jgi:hypothetical protein